MSKQWYLPAQPRALTAARLGVGACIWDGALVLAAYLAAKPPGTFAGEARAGQQANRLKWRLSLLSVSRQACRGPVA